MLCYVLFCSDLIWSDLFCSVIFWSVVIWSGLVPLELLLQFVGLCLWLQFILSLFLHLWLRVGLSGLWVPPDKKMSSPYATSFLILRVALQSYRGGTEIMVLDPYLPSPSTSGWCKSSEAINWEARATGDMMRTCTILTQSIPRSGPGKSRWSKFKSVNFL